MIFKQESYEKIKRYIENYSIILNNSYRCEYSSIISIKLFLKKILKISDIEDLLDSLINYQFSFSNYDYNDLYNNYINDLDDFILFNKEVKNINLIRFFYNELNDNLKEDFINSIKLKLFNKDYFNNFIKKRVEKMFNYNLEYFFKYKERMFSSFLSNEEINKNNEYQLNYYITLYNNGKIPSHIFLNELSILRELNKQHIYFNESFNFDKYLFDKIINMNKNSLINFLKTCLIYKNLYYEFVNLIIINVIDNCKDEEIIKLLFLNLNSLN